MTTKSRRFLWIYFAIVGSILVRVTVLDFESLDYKIFLSAWYDHFVEKGRLAGFRDDFSRYPLLYLYVVSVSTLLPLPKLYAIKLFSIICDYLAAWFVYKIVALRFPSSFIPRFGALLMLYLPTVWINSAVWGQCDAMYTTALLGVLYFALTMKPLAVMVSFGLACALKPQAVFFVPFLCGWALRERIKWIYLSIPPAVYAVCGLPAIFAGKPVWEVLFRWTQHKNMWGVILGATNWYQWIIDAHYDVFFMLGIVMAILAGCFLILVMQEAVSVTRTQWLVTSALLSVLIIPFFLPGMHERYFYAADLLALVYAFFAPRGWIVAVMVQFCSFFTYLPSLFNYTPIPRPLLALVMMTAIGIVAVDLCKPIFRNAAYSPKA